MLKSIQLSHGKFVKIVNKGAVSAAPSFIGKPMSDSISVNIQGLNELRESFNRVPKDIAMGIGLATSRIQQALKHDIIGMYNLNEAKINNAFVGTRTKSTVARGKATIENSINIKQIPIDLAKYPYDWSWGNIDTPVSPMPKKRKGKVHSVSVRRGVVKVVYGKHQYGGFTQQNGRYGTQMFERTSEERKPLRLVFGPSIADIVSWGIDHRGKLPTFDRELDNLEQFIAASIKL